MRFIIDVVLSSVTLFRTLHGNDMSMGDTMYCLSKDIMNSESYQILECLHEYVNLHVVGIHFKEGFDHLRDSPQVIFDIQERYHGSLNMFKVKHNHLYTNGLLHRLHREPYSEIVHDNHALYSNINMIRGMSWEELVSIHDDENSYA